MRDVQVPDRLRDNASDVHDPDDRDNTGWRIEDTAVRRGFYEKYITEAERFDFTFREHGLRVHPLVVQVDLFGHSETGRFDLLRQVMCDLGGILHPMKLGKPLVLHAQQTRYCFTFRDVLARWTIGLSL